VDKESKIYVAGHTGMVGSAITRKLLSEGYNNLVFTPYPEYDLTDQQTVRNFFKKKKPEYVFLAAAKVGGILANNQYRAQFIYENLMIQNNIIHESYLNGIKKLLFLGSSCVYPKNCPQPIMEEYLLTSELEYTNEPYAIAKIAGIKMCEAYNIQYGTNFISVMPTNMFGPNDNYDLEKSHVLPALIRKMHLAKCLENNDWTSVRKDLQKNPVDGLDFNSAESDILKKLSFLEINKSSESPSSVVSLKLWGTGTPFREFLYVDDMVEAVIFLMKRVDVKDIAVLQKEENHDNCFSAADFKNNHINIGSGKDLKIAELASIIKDIVGFKGTLEWDSSKPDGTPRKLLDVSRIRKLGWSSGTSIQDGIRNVYENFIR